MKSENQEPDTPQHAQQGFSRRKFGALAASGAAATTLVGGASTAAATERPFQSMNLNDRPPRPNILVIIADDMGWADLSCYGAPHISTPNLDEMARKGVRFTDGYAGSASCSPTRISLYTGKYPGRLHAGLYEPIVGSGKDLGLPPEHPTIASMLKDAGYTTAMYGKWHCGHLPWYSPTKSGWDEFFGNFGGALDYFSKLGIYGDYDLYENDVEYRDLRYYTDIVTERTVDFIQRDHRQPWLLNLNYTTPHWPWEGPNDQEVSDELSRRTLDGDPKAFKHSDGGSVAKYQEMVENMDHSIGRVMAALRRTGQLQDTVVFFFSDNGGERFSYHWPLRGEKFSMLEGGIRVPTILHWPRAIRQGQVSDVPNVTMDWTATLLELAGVEPGSDYAMDGRSLAGYLLRGEDPPSHDLFWRVREGGALRRGQWKFLHLTDPDISPVGEHLYDLHTDKREEADKAAAHPDVLDTLRAEWNRIESGLLPYPD